MEQILGGDCAGNELLVARILDEAGKKRPVGTEAAGPRIGAELGEARFIGEPPKRQDEPCRVIVGCAAEFERRLLPGDERRRKRGVRVGDRLLQREDVHHREPTIGAVIAERRSGRVVEQAPDPAGRNLGRLRIP